jgi:hypothetical protein
LFGGKSSNRSLCGGKSDGDQEQNERSKHPQQSITVRKP